MLRYCGPFAFPLSIPLLYYYAGRPGPLLAIVGLLVALIGAEAISPRGATVTPADTPRRYRALMLLFVPLQLGLIGWAIAASLSTTPLGFAALALSVGIVTGVFGALVAHEAMHSGDALESLLGTAMLSGMAYRHFRISHVYGHHRWAATERDPGTARLGEGFYHFLLRTAKEQVVMAFRFEQSRCAVRGRNRVIEDAVIMALIFGGLFIITGMRGLSFFVLQCLVAIIVLELFNYIAHYGLVRRNDENGKPEMLTDSHSWNSSNVLANALIFNMGRHSFHHRRPAAPYQSLQRIAPAPELPAGYAGSILLALVPPLWRRVMDEKTRRIRMGVGAANP